jgi:hypothetical protein
VHELDLKCGLVDNVESETDTHSRRISGTDAEHTSHTESLDLPETNERLFCEVFDKSIKRSLKQWFGGAADLSVNADQVQQGLEHVRSYL